MELGLLGKLIVMNFLELFKNQKRKKWENGWVPSIWQMFCE